MFDFASAGLYNAYNTDLPDKQLTSRVHSQVKVPWT
jgi:hypothetical protein